MGCWSSDGHVDSKEFKILLVGPRRTGKSSTGNTLLGQRQVFDTRGGQTSTAAWSVIAGHHVTVVDAQGWGSSEEFVPREEKVELLKALDLCGPEGPDVVLLVIPLLDFTELERRAVERRMEILTSGVWRHTMVLFTFGDQLRKRGGNIKGHIESGGLPLHWLMEKCRSRYHVLDNKRGIWKRTDDKGSGNKKRGSEAAERGEGEQEQVRELLNKVEDMLQENGGWHFSLHMYQRLEEEWSYREQQLRAQLRAQLEAEASAGSMRREQNMAEMAMHVEPEGDQKEEQRLEREEEQREGCLRKEPEDKEECVEGKINGEEAEEETVKVQLMRQSTEEDWEDAGCDRRGATEGERRLIEKSTAVKTRMMTPCKG